MFFQNFINIVLNFAFSAKDIPVCQTRIVRGKRGMPWDERIAIHPLGNGDVELTPVRVANPPQDDKNA